MKVHRTGSLIALAVGVALTGVAAGRLSGSAPARAAASAPAAWEETDRAHEASVRAFPAKTAGQGAEPLRPRVVGGVKVFEITATEIEWEVAPGVRRRAMAYNGQVPGPTIRVTEGDRVRVVLTNRLREPTTIHFHGVVLPNAMDGVPYVTQPSVKPGERFTYEFAARPAGSHMYHSHFGSEQVSLGLLGAFVVEPRDAAREPKVDLDVVMILNDGLHGYTINGKGFPATHPIVVRQGQRIRMRWMNEGQLIHPMHLHGMPMTVIARDGYPQPQPWKADTINVAPGERWDVIVEATEPGTWALHCHILSHAESKHGMHGMVTAVIVQK
ncbi:MAG: multicopper oxidase domain-containing protein [Armatimonadota bacterium]|nr:multicopper oxidase domain-containing protein [Armatimonadota bacterium]MDR7421482.1 multicopper oxidase domain-containing protein [Armatimonadota bacterium]MDR7453074.1 multicopper oxidase domain-containing protein [Armatimonadota bacterium]MDR7457540.1 multicopper oxidase domain-containing protein [Armatimonadota bacterium]MDR7495881.1 multicopper oxidase domain-containing protein [Armatimonadota bacterium]